MTKAFIYRDREGASRIWQNNFIKAAGQLGVRTIEVFFENFLERPKSKGAILRKIRKYHKPGDIFVARFNERKEHLIQPVYPELENIFGKRHMFPDAMAAHLYNNKKRQAGLFNQNGYPTPAQEWVQNEDDLEVFMQKHSLSFPIVRKESSGAASAGVSLIETADTKYPFVAQEYCRDNRGDLRIVVIGGKIFGFARKNRPNDFRASGSGMIDFVEQLPLKCVKTAYQVSHEFGFVCMAYDFINNNSDRPVIAEVSYTFVSEPASNCRFYYSVADGFARKEEAVGSVERLILEKLLSKGN